MSTEPLRYSMRIEWSDEDQAYIVTMPELPGCRTHGFTYEEAVREGQDAMDSWIEGYADSGRRLARPPGVVSTLSPYPEPSLARWIKATENPGEVQACRNIPSFG